MERVLSSTAKPVARSHSISLNQPHFGASAGMIEAKSIASKLTDNRALSSEEVQNLADAHNAMHPIYKRLMLMTANSREDAAQMAISNARMNHAMNEKATPEDKFMFLTVATQTTDTALEAQASSHMMRLHAENGAEPCVKKANAWAQHILELERNDVGKDINQRHISDAWKYLITQGMAIAK
jgi:hypothetical protein